MNGGLFIMIVILIVALGIWIYTETPAGKKWIKNL